MRLAAGRRATDEDSTRQAKASLKDDKEAPADHSAEPLELGYVAAAVPREHEVRLLDLRLSWWPDYQFAQSLKQYQPDLVGLSGYTHEASKVKELARVVRRLLPRSRVVVGGHHATVLPQDYNLDCFDAIVRGEGCAPFGAMVEAAAGGRDFEGIENVMLPGTRFDPKAAARMPQYPDSPAARAAPRAMGPPSLSLHLARGTTSAGQPHFSERGAGAHFFRVFDGLHFLHGPGAQRPAAPNAANGARRRGNRRLASGIRLFLRRRNLSQRGPCATTGRSDSAARS